MHVERTRLIQLSSVHLIRTLELLSCLILWTTHVTNNLIEVIISIGFQIFLLEIT